MAVLMGTRRTTRVRHDFTVDDLPWRPLGSTESPLHVLVTVRVDAEVSPPNRNGRRLDRGGVEIISREIREFSASVQADGDGSLPSYLLAMIREKHADDLIEAAIEKIGDVDVDDALLNEAGQ